MPYNHRISTREIDTSVITPVESSAGLRVVVGTAPVNLLEDPAAAVNTPIIAYSFSEGAEKIGYSDDFDAYTCCEVLDATFRVFNVGPVIFINVLDPATHVKSYSSTATVTGGVASVAVTGILMASLTITGGEQTLDKGTDYLAEFDETGGVTITLLDTAKTAGLTSLTVAASQLDPSAVTAADIIGGYNAATGVEKGIEVIRQIYPKLGMVPGLLLAPKWSATPTVAVALAAKCEDLNGLFTCECVIDMDTTTATKYTDLKTAKEAMGVVNAHAILCWPKVKLGDKVYNYSSVWAAMAAYTDTGNGDVPFKSPSNEIINMSAAVTASGAEVLLDIPQAEVVNSYGIVTAINDNGWRAWGNSTSIYPSSTDPKDRWIACRRMMSWYRNHFILTYKQKVDDPISYRLIEALVTSESIYLNSLQAVGSIAGGEISFNEDENPITQILDGHIIFHTRLGLWPPAEYIENIIEFDPTILAGALGGE